MVVKNNDFSAGVAAIVGGSGRVDRVVLVTGSGRDDIFLENMSNR